MAGAVNGPQGGNFGARFQQALQQNASLGPFAFVAAFFQALSGDQMTAGRGNNPFAANQPGANEHAMRGLEPPSNFG